MISRLLDWFSNFIAHRKGLLPLIGIGMILLNYILQWIIFPHWVASTNLFLHLGLVVALFGMLLAWAL